MIKRRVYLSMFVLLSSMLFLTACQDSVQVPKRVYKPLPVWFEEAPKDNNKLYGVATGRTIDDAINKALIDCISSVAIKITNETTRKGSYSGQNENMLYNKLFISKSIQEVKETFVSEYYIEKLEKYEDEKAVQISLQKKDLINTVLLNIYSERNDLLSFNYNTLKKEHITVRIEKINEALAHSKKIDYLRLMLESLGYKIKNKKKSLTVKYNDLLTKEMSNVEMIFSQGNVQVKQFLGMQKDILSKFDSKVKKNVQFDSSEPMRIVINNPQSKSKHTIYSHGAVISEDGKYVLSEHYGRLRYWNFSDYNVLFDLKEHTKPINKIVMSLDGKYALTAGGDGIIGYWDLQNKRLIKKLSASSSFVQSVSISDDNKYALSGGGDKVLRYWNLATGKTVKTLKGHTKGVSFVHIVKGGKFAVSASIDNTIKYWNLRTGKVIKTFRNQYGYTNSVAVSSDDSYIVSLAKNEKTFSYISLKSKKVLKSIKINPKDYFKHITFSANGKYAMYKSKIQGVETITYYNLHSGQKMLDIRGKFYGEMGAYTPNKEYLLESQNNGHDLYWRKWKIMNNEMQVILQNTTRKKKIKNNSINIFIDSCAEGYRAIRANRGMFESHGVDIYKGCRKVVISDGNKGELYSTRIEGLKIRDYKSMDQASEDSYNSSKFKQGMQSMLSEISSYDQFQYIMESK